MKQKAVTCAVFIAISAILGSIGCITAGCRNQNLEVQVVENSNVVTNFVPAKAFNDERYVWESFYFSTNRIDDAKK